MRSPTTLHVLPSQARLGRCLFSLVLLGPTTLTGCGGNGGNEQPKVQFSEVQALIAQYTCGRMGCHATSDSLTPNARYFVRTNGGVTEVGFRDWAIDQPVLECASMDPTRKRVVPGAPERSYVIDALEGMNLCGHMNRMPFNGPYLKPDEIETVARWIADGAGE